MREFIKDDFVKIKRSGYFEQPFSFIFNGKGSNDIILTTARYHDYVVQHNIDSVKGLHFKYKVIEMIEDFDGEEEDKYKELWDQDSVSYREWKIIKIN